MKAAGLYTVMLGTAALLGLCAALTGCRKELCYNHAEHALTSRALVDAEWELEWHQVHGDGIDWEEAWAGEFGDWFVGQFGLEYDSLRPEAGGGLRVQVYKGGVRENELNIDSTGGMVYMSPGEHDILLYNNDTEYITFHETDSWATAMASTRTRTRTRSGGDVLEGKTPPDQLFAAYVEGHVAERADTAAYLPVTLQPLVHTYVIVMDVEGAEHIALARGSLSGMAIGVYLQDGRASEEDGTILFEEECEQVEDFGVLAVVRSFGVAGALNEGYGTKAPGTHVLELEVTLKNGEKKLFEADVTGQLEGQPRGGVIVAGREEGWKITDEEAAGNGGSFDVELDSWGDFQDVILPLD